MAEEVLKLRTEFESAQTIRQLEELRRKTDEVRKTSVIGTKEQVAAEKQLVEVKNKLQTLNQRAYSDNARMKESYFKLGQQLRANKFAALELAQAMGADRSALGGVLMAMAGPGGWIAGAIAGLTAFALAVRSSNAEVEAMRKNLREMQATTTQQKLAEARRQLDELPVPKKGTNVLSPGWDFLYKKIFKTEDKEVLAFLTERQRLVNLIATLEKQITEEQAKQTKELREQGGRVPTGELYGPDAGEAPAPGLISLEDWRRRVNESIPQYGSLASPMSETQRAARNRGKGPKDEAIRLKSDLDPIWGSIGSSINAYIGGAFRSVFGEAKSLADALFFDILGAFIQFGVGAGLNAAFPGAGAGAGFLTAGGGVSPSGIRNARTRGGGGGQEIRVSGVLVGKGQSLLAVVHNSERVRARRGL